MKGFVFFGFAIVCLFGCFAFGAGTYDGGDGTEGDPYQIRTAEQLQSIGAYSEDWTNHFILIGDIDLSAYTGTEFNLIGNSTRGFTGVFDGNGHTISNFTYTSTTSTIVGEIGLFSRLGSGGEIKNLALSNVNIDAPIDYIVGSLVGNNHGIIMNCNFTGFVHGGHSIGGLVGGNTGTMINCHSTGTVSGDFSIGGLTGSNNGNVICSSSSGIVSGTGNAVGGLVGAGGNVISSYSTCNVNGRYYVGGLIGNDGDIISNSYSTGSVTGTSCVGRLVGSTSGTVTNCYSTGSVTGSAVGGLVACSYGVVINSYFLSLTGSDNGIGTPLTDSDMKQQGSFSGWDFISETANGTSQIWQMPTEGGYPVLSSFNGYTPALAGSGTEIDPYLINNPIELGAIYYYSNACFSLECDIDLAGIQWATAIAPAFSGCFIGNGHVISNLTIDGGLCLGLVGDLGLDAIVSDTGLENVSVEGTTLVGGLAGRNHGKVTNSYSIGTVIGDSLVGGLVGRNDGSICNSYSTGSVTATGPDSGFSDAGGLTGYNEGIVTSSYSMGSVTGRDTVGGLIGYSDNSVMNCYSTCSVFGTDLIGGLIGLSMGSVTNCYSTGSVTGDSHVGGLLGHHDATVINSYFLDTAGPDNGMGVGLPDTLMKKRESYFGWEFSDLKTGCSGDWHIEEGSYPKLTILGIEDAPVVPKVEGMDEVQCRAVLIDAGFTVGDVYYVNSLSVKSGLAVGLSVCEGGNVFINIPIDIYISLGLSGDGSEGDPWPVACVGDLESINYNRFACYYMTNDIYLAADKIYSQPVACPDLKFSFEGIFDGKGHSITNLVVEGDFGGLSLFGRIEEGATIRNVNIDKCRIDGTNHAGGLCVSNDGEIINCKSSGVVLGAFFVGGICGRNGGTITNVFSDVQLIFDGAVTSIACAGGICGRNSGTILNAISDVHLISDGEDSSGGSGGVCGVNTGIISRSRFTGKVVAGEYLGGICGENYNVIEYCFSSGAVEGGYKAGGICGQLRNGSIVSCYSKSSIKGEDVYYKGGVCGRIQSGNVIDCYYAGEIDFEGSGICDGGSNGIFSNCFWDAEKDGLEGTNPGDTNFGGIGKSTAEMQDIATFIDGGWDFVGEDSNGKMDVWYLPAGDYPRLFWEAVEGDCDYDGVVGVGDLGVIGQWWMTSQDDLGADERLLCDFDFDGVVNLSDFMMIAGNWMRH